MIQAPDASGDVSLSQSTPTLPDRFHTRDDDHVVPFAVEALDVRGRVVRLGGELNSILARHDYPEPVSRLLAELITLTLLLGTALKFEGRLIVQAQGDGPISLLVADYQTPDGVRAMANFDETRLSQIDSRNAKPVDLLGKGYLALTVDQGSHMNRYQGIVEMNGDSLEEMAQAYFLQSEQIPTVVRLAVAQSISRGDAGSPTWRSGGLLAQYLPKDGSKVPNRDLHPGDDPSASVSDREADGVSDNWTQAEVLVRTTEADELVDPQLGSDRLLFRLFHEMGVRVFEGSPISDRCTCSSERVSATVKTFAEQPDPESLVNGAIEVTCQFCSKQYRFDPETLEEL